MERNNIIIKYFLKNASCHVRLNLWFGYKPIGFNTFELHKYEI